MNSSGLVLGVLGVADSDCTPADDLGVPCPEVSLDLDGLGGSCRGVELGDPCLDASTITGIVFRAIPGDFTFTGLVC